MKWKHLDIPSSEEKLRSLRKGDGVLLNGKLYTARDKAHEKLCSMIDDNETPPFNPEGQFLYYMGPSPTPADKIIGASGPTTSYRLDPFTDKMMQIGIRGFIGKGKRSQYVRQLFPYYGAVYFSSFGGAGAYLSKRITSAKLIAFEDFGPEAIYELTVKDFPVIVINDTFGGDLYEDNITK